MPTPDDLLDPMASVLPRTAPATLAKEPESAPPNNRLFLWRMPPQWEQPDYWSQPYEKEQQICIDFYATPTYVFNDTVPETTLIHIWGISYHFLEDRPAGDIFDVQLLRNHDTLCTWTDRVVATSGDRGNRFAVCSHFRPMVVNATFDRGDQIHVRVTLRGQHPFTKVATDPATSKMRVLVNGYMARINATGDGQQAKSRNRRLPLGSISPGRFPLKSEIGLLAKALG